MSTTRSTRFPRPAVLVALVATAVALIGAGTALASTPAAQAFRDQPLVPGTPCTVTARACVDLDTKRSWLFHEGKIAHGPVPVATGGPGKETPIGHSLRVYRKEQLHHSGEYTATNGEPAPMPWSVFFQDGGIAFHEGRVDAPSAGCVRLTRDNAITWFNHLQIGDQVQVVSAKQVHADRA
ncbi:L,D-transpeptidase [Pseudonocardia sp. C8]|uniref:L,D-transpeptidase n=1 Tax=Pseudonocardia sp. C8 TaxID=2762759 RepID=UPI00164346BE|nr:L,D-transpeptidase [Pseudonocardia sp. C8]MBC3190139.1 L,D-transpeptidase [Pseudonocardia sp. C8]